jgi:hypothetical protein
MTLVASGDGELRSYSFHDATALMKFEHEMEEFLVHAGWVPVRLILEPHPAITPADVPPRVPVNARPLVRPD